MKLFSVILFVCTLQTAYSTFWFGRDFDQYLEKYRKALASTIESPLMRVLAIYKRKLQQLGLFPIVDETGVNYIEPNYEDPFYIEDYYDELFYDRVQKHQEKMTKKYRDGYIPRALTTTRQPEVKKPAAEKKLTKKQKAKKKKKKIKQNKEKIATVTSLPEIELKPNKKAAVISPPEIELKLNKEATVVISPETESKLNKNDIVDVIPTEEITEIDTNESVLESVVEVLQSPSITEISTAVAPTSSNNTIILVQQPSISYVNIVILNNGTNGTHTEVEVEEEIEITIGNPGEENNDSETNVEEEEEDETTSPISSVTITLPKPLEIIKDIIKGEVPFTQNFNTKPINSVAKPVPVKQKPLEVIKDTIIKAEPAAIIDNIVLPAHDYDKVSAISELIKKPIKKDQTVQKLIEKASISNEKANEILSHESYNYTLINPRNPTLVGENIWTLLPLKENIILKTTTPYSLDVDRDYDLNEFRKDETYSTETTTLSVEVNDFVAPITDGHLLTSGIDTTKVSQKSNDSIVTTSTTQVSISSLIDIIQNPWKIPVLNNLFNRNNSKEPELEIGEIVKVVTVKTTEISGPLAEIYEAETKTLNLILDNWLGNASATNIVTTTRKPVVEPVAIQWPSITNIYNENVLNNFEEAVRSVTIIEDMSITNPPSQRDIFETTVDKAVPTTASTIDELSTIWPDKSPFIIPELRKVEIENLTPIIESTTAIYPDDSRKELSEQVNQNFDKLTTTSNYESDIVIIQTTDALKELISKLKIDDDNLRIEIETTGPITTTTEMDQSILLKIEITDMNNTVLLPQSKNEVPEQEIDLNVEIEPLISTDLLLREIDTEMIDVTTELSFTEKLLRYNSPEDFKQLNKLQTDITDNDEKLSITDTQIAAKSLESNDDENYTQISQLQTDSTYEDEELFVTDTQNIETKSLESTDDKSYTQISQLQTDDDKEYFTTDHENISVKSLELVEESHSKNEIETEIQTDSTDDSVSITDTPNIEMKSLEPDDDFTKMHELETDPIDDEKERFVSSTIQNIVAINEDETYTYISELHTDITADNVDDLSITDNENTEVKLMKSTEDENYTQRSELQTDSIDEGTEYFSTDTQNILVKSLELDEELQTGTTDDSVSVTNIQNIEIKSLKTNYYENYTQLSEQYTDITDNGEELSIIDIQNFEVKSLKLDEDENVTQINELKTEIQNTDFISLENRHSFLNEDDFIETTTTTDTSIVNLSNEKFSNIQGRRSNISALPLYAAFSKLLENSKQIDKESVTQEYTTTENYIVYDIDPKSLLKLNNNDKFLIDVDQLHQLNSEGNDNVYIKGIQRRSDIEIDNDDVNIEYDDIYTLEEF